MTPTPHSPSLVLRSSHILLIRIESAKIESWRGPPAGQQHRTAHLEVVLEEILKGRTRQKNGERIVVNVDQFRNNAFWTMMNVEGIWSSVSIEPATRLVIFAASTRYAAAAADDAGQLLVEPECRGIATAAEALTGVRLAIRSASGNMPVGELLKEANDAAASLDHIFVEYLATKFSDPALVQHGTFAVLMRLLENPELPLTTRASLLTAIFDETMASTTFSDDDFNAFAITLFHLLGLAHAEPLQSNIASVYLPNLLGLNGGVAPRTSDFVFKEQPGERQKIRRILEIHSGDAAADHLRDWLR